MNISKLLQFEENEVCLAIPSDWKEGKIDIDEINKDIEFIASSVHERIISDLIYTFVSNRFHNHTEILSICFDIESGKMVSDIDLDEIPSLCEELHIAFLNSKFRLRLNNSKLRVRSKIKLIELGAVYTPSDVAKTIVDASCKASDACLANCKILDFACGTGRFYQHIVDRFDDKPKAITNNIYAIDIDPVAIAITRLKALSYFSNISTKQCQAIKKHIIVKNGLRMANSLFHEPDHLSSADLDGLIDGGFDLIVSNPPYLALKPNKSKSGVDDACKIQEQVSYFRNCGLYSFAIEGILNLYQLSIEMMLRMLKDGGILGTICPSTLFGDTSASKLRKHLLTNNQIISIQFFAEDKQLFENVTQATNIFILKKGAITDSISIIENEDKFDVSLKLIKELFPTNLEIPVIQSSGWNILYKLAKFPKLKDYTEIRNRRGELDLTIFKDYITTNPTPYRLVRGNMIGENEIKRVNNEFVSEEFISTRSSTYLKFDFNKTRLVGQQISNGTLRKRLKFVFCNNNDIIGNSCNYLSAAEKTLKKLYLLLNSSLLNWRFKITSSNNHVNNYELAELPIIDLNQVDDSTQFASQTELDEYVGKLYGLDFDEIKLISR